MNFQLKTHVWVAPERATIPAASVASTSLATRRGWGTGWFGWLLLVLPFLFAGAHPLGAALADELSTDTPLYRTTLERALRELEGSFGPATPAMAPARSGSDGIPGSARESGDDVSGKPLRVQGAPASGQPVLATTVPGALTACVDGGQTWVCTAAPATTTNCPVGSNTFCVADPQCGPTSRPPTQVTLCRSDHTGCPDGQPLACTVQPGTPTTCPTSQTFCPSGRPGIGDPNCFTFVPGPQQATLCQSMQTQCIGNQQHVCTRDPASTTQCTHSSRTACTTDSHCVAGPPVATGGDPLCLVEPGTAAAGSSATIGIFCIDTPLMQNEMHAWFGDDIDVEEYSVVSMVESYAQIAVHPDAVPGPRLVFVHGGDSPLGSPEAWGEYVLAVGYLEVTNSTGVDEGLLVAAAPALRLIAAPNPFSSSTTLQYELAGAGRVRVMIFDALGRLVDTLRDGEEAAGQHALEWDGRSGRGGRVVSGVYFAMVETPTSTVVRKIVVRD